MKLCNSRLSVNWEMQRGALAAYSAPPSHIPSALEELRERRDYFVKRINEIDGLRVHTPKGAFYAFVKLTAPAFKDDSRFAYDLMEKSGVVVAPGGAFSPLDDGQYFRAVFLPPRSQMEEALTQLERYMRGTR